MVVDPDSKKLILAHQSPSGAVSVKAHQVDVQERRTPHDTEFVLETWPAGPDRAAGHDKIEDGEVLSFPVMCLRTERDTNKKN